MALDRHTGTAATMWMTASCRALLVSTSLSRVAFLRAGAGLTYHRPKSLCATWLNRSEWRKVSIEHDQDRQSKDAVERVVQKQTRALTAGFLGSSAAMVFL